MIHLLRQFIFLKNTRHCADIYAIFFLHRIRQAVKNGLCIVRRLFFFIRTQRNILHCRLFANYFYLYNQAQHRFDGLLSERLSIAARLAVIPDLFPENTFIRIFHQIIIGAVFACIDCRLSHGNNNRIRFQPPIRYRDCPLGRSSLLRFLSLAACRQSKTQACANQ